jgi:DnaK suppressor protein
MAVKKKAKKKAAARPKAKKTVKKPARAASKKAARKKTAKKTVKRAAKKAAKGTAPRKAARAAKVPEAPRMPAALSKRKDQLRKILMKKRAEVVEGLEARMGEKLTRETGQKIDSAMDTADQSAQDVDQVIDYSLLEMKYEQYKDIADALRKLDNDTFGLCEECGNEISIKRLEVAPLARYCIECKTRKEELEKIQREETRFKE